MTPINGLCYLATPYSKYAGGLEQALIAAARLAAKLMLAGVKVYSPIAHTHPLAIYGGIDPLDHSIWLPFDRAMMDAAAILIVAHMPGWRDSVGITHEIGVFEAAGKPIFDLDPATLTMVKRCTATDNAAPAQGGGVTDARSNPQPPHLNPHSALDRR